MVGKFDFFMYIDSMILSSQPKLPYQSLPVNHIGRDYFVGDIHGEFAKLHEDMKKMGFRFDIDRIISVGDLVDRGEHSEWAEEWLRQPYFYAVRGNHEELYLQWRSLKDNKDAQRVFESEMYFPNGGRWVADTDEDTHERLFSIFSNLPYMITVPTAKGKLVGAVHAGLPDGCSWPQMINEPLTPHKIEDMIWSRNRILHALGEKSAMNVVDEGVIPGLDAVVCGHIIVPQPIWAGKFCYIETAGWRSKGHFTIIDIDHIVNTARNKGQ